MPPLGPHGPANSLTVEKRPHLLFLETKTGGLRFCMCVCLGGETWWLGRFFGWWGSTVDNRLGARQPLYDRTIKKKCLSLLYTQSDTRAHTPLLPYPAVTLSAVGSVVPPSRCFGQRSDTCHLCHQMKINTENSRIYFKKEKTTKVLYENVLLFK